MNIITASTSFFERFLVNYIKNWETLGLEQLSKVLQKADDAIAATRPKRYTIINKKPRTIQTTMGMFSFVRRYYYDQIQKEYIYLLDARLGIPKRDKVMYDVKLNVIKLASEMSYSKAGKYGCKDGLPLSKSTVCRLIKNTNYYIEEDNTLIPNDGYIHIQLDEKYVPIVRSSKKKLYTLTIFKGVKKVGKKRVLLNRTLISGQSLKKLFIRLNKTLKDKYKVTLDDEVFLSGDMAGYIQNASEKVKVCKAKYVPDKYHIEYALKNTVGHKANDYELNDAEFLAGLVKQLKENKKDVDASKLKRLITSNPSCFESYLDQNYEGCSQECMNSHYFAKRFSKIPNKFKKATVDKIANLICAKENGNKIKIGFNTKYYDEVDLHEYEWHQDALYRYDLDTTGMKYETRKNFNKLVYGDYLI